MSPGVATFVTDDDARETPNHMLKWERDLNDISMLEARQQQESNRTKRNYGIV